MILLIGSEGSMGQRYQRILNYLNLDFRCFDVITHPHADLNLYSQDIDKFIIATPTITHYDLIVQLSKFNKPILCEKPITHSELDLKKILDLKPMLTMVNQYLYMPIEETDFGSSYYNYFRHGSDGLHWDCINIIGLAKEGAWIAGESPTWECQINGRKLSIADMDKAYIYMLSHWNENAGENLDYIRLSHEKIFKREFNI